MNLLFALRIHGPLDLVSFAERVGRPSIQVDRELWELEKQGLANYPTWKTGTWSVTEKGRREVDHHEVEATGVRRDEARACVGRASDG